MSFDLYFFIFSLHIALLKYHVVSLRFWSRIERRIPRTQGEQLVMQNGPRVGKRPRCTFHLCQNVISGAAVCNGVMTDEKWLLYLELLCRVKLKQQTRVIFPLSCSYKFFFFSLSPPLLLHCCTVCMRKWLGGAGVYVPLHASTWQRSQRTLPAAALPDLLIPPGGLDFYTSFFSLLLFCFCFLPVSTLTCVNTHTHTY